MTEPTRTHRILAIPTEGEVVDLTESVLALYDLVRTSPYYGSGMYAVEEVLPLLRLARTLGLADLENVEAYIAEHDRQEAAYKARQENMQAVIDWQPSDPPSGMAPTPTPKTVVPSEALAVLDPDEERVVEQHFDAPPVKEQVRQGPPLPIATPSIYLQE